MKEKQWLAASKEVFEQTSLRNRIKYIDRWGLPKEIQQARDATRRRGANHDRKIREGK